MLLDKNLVFASKQAVTSSAASASIVDIITARNLGVGERLYLLVLCTTAMTDSGSDSTVVPTLRTSATQSGGALNGTIKTLATLPTFAATSAAGTSVIIALPPASYLEYNDVYFTVANGDLTTGSFSAFIVTDADLQTIYPAGYTVS